MIPRVRTRCLCLKLMYPVWCCVCGICVWSLREWWLCVAIARDDCVSLKTHEQKTQIQTSYQYIFDARHFFPSSLSFISFSGAGRPWRHRNINKPHNKSKVKNFIQRENLMKKRCCFKQNSLVPFRTAKILTEWLYPLQNGSVPDRSALFHIERKRSIQDITVMWKYIEFVWILWVTMCVMCTVCMLCASYVFCVFIVYVMWYVCVWDLYCTLQSSQRQCTLRQKQKIRKYPFAYTRSIL